MTRHSGRAGGTYPKEAVCVAIRSESDIVAARQKGRQIAADLGFRATDTILVATVISELARNIVRYAKAGDIILEKTENGSTNGIAITARDDGPGIWNIERAMQVGYSTSGGLGLGLPGVRRLMDEFEVISKVGEGTTVKTKKWNR